MDAERIEIFVDHIATTDSQTYHGNVVLASSTELRASSVEFTRGVDAAAEESLSVVAPRIRIEGDVGRVTPLTSVDFTGDLQLAGSIFTSGPQTYHGSIILLADASFEGTTIRLESIDAEQNVAAGLTVNGEAFISGTVGATFPLDSLTLNEVTLTGGIVLTFGSQTYSGDVFIPSDIELFGDARFDGEIGGAGGAHFARKCRAGERQFIYRSDGCCRRNTLVEWFTDIECDDRRRRRTTRPNASYR